MKKIKFIGLSLGLLLFVLFYISAPQETEKIYYMSAIAALMAVWWITEAIPLAATALLPIVLFPLFGISSGEKISQSYINSTIFLFLGGFLLALAMEKWNLHKRIALKIILLLGVNPQKIILGFMCASGFLSMWISNTATAVMMLPIGLAIIHHLEKEFSSEKISKFSTAIMLGIAYSCSIGGVATLIGTPPNLSYQRIFHIMFPDSPEITFAQWLIIFFPFAIILMVVAWKILVNLYLKKNENFSLDKNLIQQQYHALGKKSFEEKVVQIFFLTAALLWIFRSEINLGFFTIPGWGNLLLNSKFVNDGTVAIFIAILLFVFPAKKENQKLLDVQVFQKIPWDVILLFGGGFALANGFVESGLSEFIGKKFEDLRGVSSFASIFSVTTVITFLTELTSNTATSEMVLPILGSIAQAIEVDPVLLMLPATIAASMAFMMPVATPPNAIVFGSQRVKISDMIKTGIWLNFSAIILITLFTYFIVPLVL